MSMMYSVYSMKQKKNGNEVARIIPHTQYMILEKPEVAHG